MEKEIYEAYKKGAEDAWEAAKKVKVKKEDGGLSIKELEKLFGRFSDIDDIFISVTALEAVEKIQKHEKQKKDFQVGDEVKDNFGYYAVVTNVNNGDSKIYLLFSDGSFGENNKGDWVRTGHCFPQIAEVFGALHEDMVKEEESFLSNEEDDK